MKLKSPPHRTEGDPPLIARIKYGKNTKHQNDGMKQRESRTEHGWPDPSPSFSKTGEIDKVAPFLPLDDFVLQRVTCKCNAKEREKRGRERGSNRT